MKEILTKIKKIVTNIKNKAMPIASKVAIKIKYFATVAFNATKKFIQNIPVSDIIDFSYFNENKKMIVTRMIAIVLFGVMIIPMAFLQTRDSAAEDELNLNATYTGAHGSSYVVTLLSEVEDESIISNEVFSLSQEYIDGKAEKERLAKEAEEKRLEEERKKKEAEAKKNGTYTAPPATPASGFVQYDVPLSYEWQVYTYNLCKEYGVSYEVMLGLMYAESTFRFNASSGVAHGICQIHQCHESYAKSIGISNYKEPEGNIKLGVMFMSGNLKAQNGDYHKALICYNYGSGGAQKHCFSKGIYQTAYSRKVMAYAHNLKPVS